MVLHAHVSQVLAATQWSTFVQKYAALLHVAQPHFVNSKYERRVTANHRGSLERVAPPAATPRQRMFLISFRSRSPKLLFIAKSPPFISYDWVVGVCLASRPFYRVRQRVFHLRCRLAPGFHHELWLLFFGFLFLWATHWKKPFGGWSWSQDPELYWTLLGWLCGTCHRAVRLRQDS